MIHLQLVMCGKGPPKTSVRQLDRSDQIRSDGFTVAAQVVDLISRTGNKTARSHTKLKNERLQLVRHKHILFASAKIKYLS